MSSSAGVAIDRLYPEIPLSILPPDIPILPPAPGPTPDPGSKPSSSSNNSTVGDVKVPVVCNVG